MKLLPGKEAEYAEYVRTNTVETEEMRTRDRELDVALRNEGFDPSGVRSIDYVVRIITYTEQWAELMEARIAKGEKLVDIIEETSREADTDGITGFQYGCAVQALANFWVHGESLRQWHNLKTQLGAEGAAANAKPGAVLNPALLSIE